MQPDRCRNTQEENRSWALWFGWSGSESHFLLYRTHKEGRFLWNDWTKPWNLLVRTWRLYLKASKFVIMCFISVIIIRIHVWSVICELCRWHSVLCSHGEDRAAAPLFYVKLSVSVQSHITPCFAALDSSDHAQSVAFCSVSCYSAVSTDSQTFTCSFRGHERRSCWSSPRKTLSFHLAGEQRVNMDRFSHSTSGMKLKWHPGHNRVGSSFGCAL